MTNQKQQILEETANHQKAAEIITSYFQMMDQRPAGPEEHHNEGTLLNHTIMVYEEAKEIRPENQVLHIMALYHDIGKLMTQHQENDARHDIIGSNMLDWMTAETDLDNYVYKNVRQGAESHLMIKGLDSSRDQTLNATTILDMVKSLSQEEEISIPLIIDLAVADERGREPGKDLNRSEMREKVTAAQEVMWQIGKSTVLSNTDVEEHETEKIIQVKRQLRTEKLKDKIETIESGSD